MTIAVEARAIGTAVVSRAEVAAALAKTARVRLVARAATLAWEQRLRGYGAVHLATAPVWRETLGETVTVATFVSALNLPVSYL